MNGRKSWLLSFLPILFVVLIIAWLAANLSIPEKNPKEEARASLRVITVKTVPFAPVEYGYGIAEPARVWKAVSQVKGEIVSLHKQLHSGELITENAQLVQIDPTDYELIVEQLESGVRRIQADLSGLQKEAENARSAITLEK
jgi:hypothetical protein